MNHSVSISAPDHISAVEAGRQFGYTNDYITRLAREKKVLANRVGKQWYVNAKSLESFIAQSEISKKEYTERLRAERRRERVAVSKTAPGSVPLLPLQSSRASVLAKTGMVFCASLVLGALIIPTLASLGNGNTQQASALAAIQKFAQRLYGFGTIPENALIHEVDDVSKANAAATVLSGDLPTQNGDAVVIVPPDDARRNAAIADSFSDEVSVVRSPDGKSGIITPVFKKASSTEYRYLMVPLREESTQRVRSP